MGMSLRILKARMLRVAFLVEIIYNIGTDIRKCVQVAQKRKRMILGVRRGRVARFESESFYFMHT